MLTNLVFFASVALLWLAVANFFTIRRPAPAAERSESVTVLIPVRNEEENIADLVLSLQAQQFINKPEIIFINDSSTDDTADKLQEAQDGGAQIKVINAPELPDSWLGKPWALQQGYLQAKGEIVVTLDADVRLTSTAIAQALGMLGDRSFISPYPRQIARTFSERLIQPLLQWSWMSTVPLRIAEKSARTSLAVANGQFFMVRKSALDQIGGFNAIAAEVLDDMELARALIKSGALGGVADGSTLAQTRMYKNFFEIKAGYGKSLWKAFGSQSGSAAAIAFLFITGIAPVIAWFAGHPLGFFAYQFIVITRALSAARSRGRILDSILHPISCAVLIYLIIYSWRARGVVAWKGRTL
ncbi:MAG: glycosyltransferase family 2 protein [Candidatus Planktophila sp.]|nr:glycosyltransferase family 2 protein [Candidatus Planktophila sp.]